MRPLMRLSARLLAVLLLVQWTTAFGLCLERHAASGLLAEICTAEGVRHVLIGEDGSPLPDGAGDVGNCTVCPIPHALEAPQPVLAAAPVGYAEIVDFPLPAGRPVAPARAPPQQPRAPPTA